MTQKIAYGKSSLAFELPWDADVTVVEPMYVPVVPDQSRAVTNALRSPTGSAPLHERVRADDKIGIVFSDITRPTPYHILLPPLLNELSHVPDRNIVLFNATGTHRTNTEAELASILGADVVRRFRVVQNDCTDASAHTVVGTTPSGNEISILTEFLECDVKIPTGFIEPHFFAGMSGGGKAIMPGLATLPTVLRNHSAAHMDHPNVRWGITDGNSLWEEVRDAALLTDPSFILNIALNRDQEITAVFAGDFLEAHAAGCQYVRQHAMAAVEDRFDIVVTSNSGYPLDLNMYQTVKGMSAADQIVREGGHIVIAAECWDGIPDHGRYGRILKEAETLDQLLETIRSPGYAEHDMWQVQIHALICRHANVHFYSDNLTDEQIRSRFLEPTTDISSTLAQLLSASKDKRICVLPEGPMTIPYVA